VPLRNLKSNVVRGAELDQVRPPTCSVNGSMPHREWLLPAMKVRLCCGHKPCSQPVAGLPDRWSAEIAIDFFREHPMGTEISGRRSFLTLRGGFSAREAGRNA